MPNMIIKHRRGTTDEWNNSKVIPAEGELVIEETNDGRQKFKLGNGYSLFKDLPYTDEKIQESVDLANARVDNFIAMTDVDNSDPLYEVQDIRVGYDGVTYESAGEAVRAIGEDTNNLRNSLQQFINADAVDGLLYENNMLQLTASGVPVGEPVEVVGGSGGGGTGTSIIIRVKNELSSTALSVPEDSPVQLKFSFTSTEDDIPTGDGTCTIQVDGLQKASFGIKQGSSTIDIKDYVKPGSNNVRVTCMDQYGNSRSLVYTVTVIELRITSIFDCTAPFETDITFKYTPYGLIEKDIHFVVDDKEVAKTTITASGKQSTQILPAMSHGVHKLDVYMTATINNVTVPSNHLIYDVMCLESGKVDALLASVYTETEIVQGNLVSIPYVVYDPSSLTSTIQLIVSYMKGGERVEHSNTTITVDRAQQYWNTRQYPQGNVTFTIQYKYNWNEEYQQFLKIISKSYDVVVTEPEIDVEPVTNDLELFLTSAGRTNQETNLDHWTYGDITTTFENFNWRSNGWIPDDNGDTCLRLTGDAKATINFMPFEKDFREFGKTIEFEFAVRNVNNRDAKVISCYSDGIGFEATADTAFLKSEAEKVSCNYKDEERLRIGFSVERVKDGTRFISIYLDGVLSGITRYSETDNFQQKNPVKITLGSPYCGLDIYSVRIYSTALNYQQMLDNYVYDMNDPVQKVDIFSDNDIYDDYTGLLSYKKLKQKVPTVTFIGKMPTYKGDKKKNSVRMIFEHPGHPELNFDEILAQIDVQGTSSAGYVRKNWKVKTNKKYVHMIGELPAKVFCLKVDYAEATGTHNTQNANLIETFYDKPVPPMKEEDFPASMTDKEKEEISKVRTTITGFPIVIFELDTDDMDLIQNITMNELEGRTDVKFSSKGNFNYDKDAEDVFAFNDNYDVECWEFAKNEDPQSFLTPWPETPLDYWEARYHPKLGELEDLQDAKNDAAVKELGDEMLTRFKKMYEWVHSTARGEYNGRPQASGARLVDSNGNEITYVDKVNKQSFTHDTDEYRLAKFRDEFEQYFDLDYAAIYYVYTFFALMVDQRAKNMFLTFWRDNAYGPNDDATNPGKWYPYFYDNDTSYGISNKGHLDFDYYHQDTDSINGANVYNGGNSVLWKNFADAFVGKIQSTYQHLRTSGKLNYNKVIDNFVNKGSDTWSASVYNEDADYKYISVSSEEIDGVQQDYPYLFQIRGNGEHHLKYFVENRVKFCDSKWKCADYMNTKDYTARVNIYNPTSSESYAECARWDALPEAERGPRPDYYETYQKINQSCVVRAPSANISIKPYSRMYYAVQYGMPTGDDPTKGMISKLATNTNTFLNFNHTDTTQLNDFETTIYGARDISSMGDLSNLYAKEVVVTNAVKLTDLQVGCDEVGPNGEQYFNPNLTKLTVGNNTLLKKINIANCPNLTGSFDVSGCSNIEEIYAEGSGITSVALPVSGYVKTLKLPNTITNLTIKNQLYIQTLSIENYTGIKTLCIDDCPTIDTVQLLNNCKDASGKYTVERVRLTGINWPNATLEFIRSLYSIAGLDEQGFNTNDAYLIGTAHISKLTGAEMAEIKSHYPYLTITYDELTATITFMDSTGTIVLDEQTIVSRNSKAGNAKCPVLSGKVETPFKKSTPQYHFHWKGWTRDFDNQLAVELDALHAVSADRIVYPAFEPELRNYPVRFWNGDKLESTVLAWYGSEAIYGLDNSGDTDGDGVDQDKEPIKQNTAHPELFEFTGWHPQPSYITGELDCYAQYYIDEGDYYTVGNNDIEYALMDSNTLAVTAYKNAAETVIKIPEQFTIETTPKTTVEIGGFKDSLIELVDIPDSVHTYSASAFENCDNLSDITIGENVTQINDLAFAKCYRLKNVNYNARNAIVNRTTVQNSPFEGSGSGFGINVHIGKDVEVIPSYLFNQYNDSVGYQNILNDLSWDPDCKCTRIEAGAFRNTNIPVFNIPETIKTIGTDAFANNHRIKEVIIPNSVTHIGTRAFQNLSVVEKIKLPASVTSIGETAFSHANKLQTIELDENNYTFSVVDGCLIKNANATLLKATNNAIIPDFVQSIEQAAFAALEDIAEVSIPSGVIEVPTYFAVGCYNLDKVTLPESLEVINTQAFYKCTKLGTSVGGVLVIPDSVTTIRSNAFAQCDALTDVTLPKNLVTMGSGSNFQDCQSLKTIRFRNSTMAANQYGHDALRGCTNLTDIYWPGTQVEAEQKQIWKHMGVNEEKVTIHYEYEVRD